MTTSVSSVRRSHNDERLSTMAEGKQGGTSALKIMLGVAGGIALISCCGIGGCIALIGMGAKGVADKQQQEQKQSAEAKKTPITVSPAALLAEYEANEVAADGKYNGKFGNVLIKECEFVD